MVKTYVLAPNWTTAPPPHGPIKLGHILDDLTEFVALNRHSVLEIPEDDKNPVDTKSGFTTSRGELVSGGLGIFAKLLGQLGVGAGPDIYYKKNKNDVLTCKTLDTITFDPTAEYIAESMQLPRVHQYMKFRQFKDPVYMITGLKIARGSCLQSTQSKEKGLKLEGGLNPPGTPGQIGVKTGLSIATTEGDSWEHSTDFIVAFRVKKIWYHRDELMHETYKDKAVMHAGNAVKAGKPMLLMFDDFVSLEDVFISRSLTTEMETEDGEEVIWIVPKDDDNMY